MNDQYEAIGSNRAERERDVIERAIDELGSILDRPEVDADDCVEEAHAVRESLPERYRAEARGMADVLSTPETVTEIYMFGLSEVSSAFDDDDEPDPDEGCTNAVVSARRAANGAPLVLKNRDIKGRGVRPQALVEYPSIGDRHGFLTISTCGVVSVFQGVNEHGFVAANTYIEADREEVSTEEELRNGVVVRRLLEECASVAAAKALLEELPIRRMPGLTLSLADGEEHAVIEINPAADEVRQLDGEIVPRTNHLPYDGTAEHESSVRRLDRIRAVSEEFPDGVSRAELLSAARDHEHDEPGQNTICRHETDDGGPRVIGDSTTVSTTIFRGGEPAIYGTVTTPCVCEPTRHEYGDEHPAELRSGRRWLDVVQ